MEHFDLRGKTLTITDYQTLMLPVLRLAVEGETRVPLAAEKIADQLNLTGEEREEILPSGRKRVLHNRIHWAKFFMSKAGLIESPTPQIQPFERERFPKPVIRLP